MNTHNLLRLTRKLREERDEKIIYGNRSSSWKTIFKKHPLESKSNESLFQDMVHCQEHWGDTSNGGGEVILRSGYTWTLLQKIAKNSLNDCANFYEIAQHTMLKGEGVLKNSIHNWFKKALTVIYLSHKDAPDNLNYFSELSQKDKESTLGIAFQYYGVNALPMYEKLKDDFAIKNFNEKLILWYWEADRGTTNLVDQVIDKLSEKEPLKYDLEYIADNFKPNNIFKNQSLEINKRFIPFSDITVITERYEIKSERAFSVIAQETDKIKLDVIFNLFCCQNILRSIFTKRLQDLRIGSTVGIKPSSYDFLIDGEYDSPSEVFNSYNITKETRKSMEEFISLNKSLANKYSNKTVNAAVIEYWNEVQAVFTTKVLNEDLKSKDIKKNRNKV